MIKSVAKELQKLWKCTSGATSIEYAIMASGITVAIVATVNELGDPVDGLIGQVKTAWDANFGS